MKFYLFYNNNQGVSIIHYIMNLLFYTYYLLQHEIIIHLIKMKIYLFVFFYDNNNQLVSIIHYIINLPFYTYYLLLLLQHEII